MTTTREIATKVSDSEADALIDGEDEEDDAWAEHLGWLEDDNDETTEDS